MSKPSKIKVYSDEEFKDEIESLQWENKIVLDLVDGTREILDNTAMGGEKVQAKAYLRNETDYKYMITKTSYPDPKVKISVSRAVIEPKSFVILTVSYDVPEEVDPEDTIAENKIDIEGYFLYEKRN